jgi:hypothetical protein
MIRLSDSELQAVMDAAAPLEPRMRDAFLRSVAHALTGREVGPGLVARTCREVQREFFDPPDLSARTMSAAGAAELWSKVEMDIGGGSRIQHGNSTSFYDGRGRFTGSLTSTGPRR